MLKLFYDRAQSFPEEMGLMHIIQNTGLIDKSLEMWNKLAASRARYRLEEAIPIGVLGDNSARWLYHVLGAFGAGLTVAVLNPDHEKETLVKAAQACGIRRLVCDNGCLKIGLSVSAKVAGLSVMSMDSIAGLVEVPWDEGDTREGRLLFFDEEGNPIVWEEKPEKMPKDPEDRAIVQKLETNKITLITRPLYRIEGFDMLYHSIKAGCVIAIGNPATQDRDRSAVRPDYHVK